jgi:hypothetical protein
VQDRIERLPILLDAITSKSRPADSTAAGRGLKMLGPTGKDPFGHLRSGQARRIPRNK